MQAECQGIHRNESSNQVRVTTVDDLIECFEIYVLKHARRKKALGIYGILITHGHAQKNLNMVYPPSQALYDQEGQDCTSGQIPYRLHEAAIVYIPKRRVYINQVTTLESAFISTSCEILVGMFAILSVHL